MRQMRVTLAIAFSIALMTASTAVAESSIAPPKNAPAANPGKASLTLFPNKILLSGRAARQLVIAENLDTQGRSVGQVAEGLTLESLDSKIVRIEDGRAIPVANGQTRLKAKAGDREAFSEVVVQGMEKPIEWNFRNDVQSVFSKTGCNSGPCHGAQSGKKGFKLSLRGYDAEGDYNVMTRQARGRRITLADPGRSLLLTKATAAIPHGGSKRFDVDSLEYRVVSDWIASGAPGPKADDARMTKLEITPSGCILKKKDVQQLLVSAHFSDGTIRDVTHWSKFTSTNAEVATIDDKGKMEIIGNGEGAISAMFLNTLVMAPITAPYDQADLQYIFANAPRTNFIDDMTLDKLKSLNIPPSPDSSDEEFVRRAFVDTIGTLPNAEETRKFLANQKPDKRDELIEHLLQRPEFVDYWSLRWSDLLLVNSEKLKRPAMWAYHQWIKNNVAANTPWDEFVRQLLTARGSTLENGAANFFVLHQDTLELTETVSMAFMGMSINCARCHNHPLEKWTNDQYFGMANLLGRVRLKNGPGEGNFIVYSATEGDVFQPLTGKPQMPRPLDGHAVPIEAPKDRRIPLSDWLTSPENPLFARSITNRVWANFMGVGMVEKVDDIRFTNPASNEKLFAALAKHLVDNKYDLKQLMRTILRSKTYQRSSLALPENVADRRFYSHYYPRRMLAEVIIDGVSQVTEVPTMFPSFPTGWRALQLPDSEVPSYFLDSFGKPDRDVTSEDERSNAMGMVQVLHISNGDTINKKLQTPGGFIDRVLKEKLPMPKIVDEIYLSALSRYPHKAEKDRLLAMYSEMGKDDERLYLEDLFWGVLSSKEFLFNH